MFFIIISYINLKIRDQLKNQIFTYILLFFVLQVYLHWNLSLLKVRVLSLYRCRCFLIPFARLHGSNLDACECSVAVSRPISTRPGLLANVIGGRQDHRPSGNVSPLKSGRSAATGFKRRCVIEQCNGGDVICLVTFCITHRVYVCIFLLKIRNYLYILNNCLF